MKNTFLKTLCTFLVLISFIGCKKEEEPENDNPYATFSSYFNCYINGEYFESRSMHSCFGNRVTYYLQDYYNSEAGFLIVNGLNCHADILDISTVGIVMRKILEPETIELQTDLRVQNIYVRGVYDSLIDHRILYDKIVSGQLHIEKLVPHVPGERVGLIKGTFEFVLHNGDGDTARVSSGKFGMKLPNP
ncbi:MAG: hypothetical protein JJU02_13410 [Cryomorphaceae bacterium]|nr:hypothetical protein [Cryomorphaceae bacterium]